MKISISILLLCVLSLVFSSCASVPEKTVTEAAGLPDQSVSEVLPVTASDSNDAATDVTDAPAVLVETEAAPVDAQSLPGNIETVPAVPSGDKLLYFYPEPELSFTVPSAPATAVPAAPESVQKTAVPAPAKTVPAKESTVQKNETPKTETTPAKSGDAAKTDIPAVLPGIWETEPVSPAVSAASTPIAPSRSVALAVGQTLEVLYPGSGWVYLGDSSSQNGLGYQTRKLEKTDTLFTFKALKAGNYILDFSRFDVLQDSFSADAIAVKVAETAVKSTEKIRAPDYRAFGGVASASVPESPVSVTVMDEPALKVASRTGVPVSASPVSADAETLLKQSKAALAANDPAKALDLLTAFFAAAFTSLDEGWFLRGRAYEANGASRDVRKALAAYETLVSAYPESLYWKDADDRIRYIKQFYLRIR